MSDDVTEPRVPAPETPAETPRKRRPPSQSDIHGISTIAAVPGTAGGGRGASPSPDPDARPGREGG